MRQIGEILGLSGIFPRSAPKFHLSFIIASMALTLAEVEHIALLARLDLTDEEKSRYREQLSAILDYAARLQALDTSGIPPTSSVLPPHTVLRPDQPQPGLTSEQLLLNAPAVEAGQFRVPPVLE
jgi:aspartyl-tRNA(Asn)/glutamyl-tRNA(Gln) amidotransferase subunit C